MIDGGSDDGETLSLPNVDTSFRFLLWIAYYIASIEESV